VTWSQAGAVTPAGGGGEPIGPVRRFKGLVPVAGKPLVEWMIGAVDDAVRPKKAGMNGRKAETGQRGKGSVRRVLVDGGEQAMEVTKVTLRPVAMNKVCAIASVVLDDAFVVHDLRVVNGEKGLFVAMPSRKLPNGDFRDICHPINADAREQFQSAVLKQFDLDGGLEYFTSPEAFLAHDSATDLD
jgi:stage V sporulation protein G